MDHNLVVPGLAIAGWGLLLAKSFKVIRLVKRIETMENREDKMFERIRRNIEYIEPETAALVLEGVCSVEQEVSPNGERKTFVTPLDIIEQVKDNRL